MSLEYIQHQKVSLKKHQALNEAWLHDRIADNPTILGLGDLRVLDRERRLSGGGRLDMLLLDEESNRRFEVEIMLGATDPSHIIRAIEYWDIERRRYPGYEHVAVLIAEDITARFLNVISLMSGSIPLIAMQLDALRVRDELLLNFVQVLDQTELRVDDTDFDTGGEQVDRQFWESRVGAELMSLCDEILSIANQSTQRPQQLNYMKRYIGLRSNGVVKNFVSMSPKRTKGIVHVKLLNRNVDEWESRLEDAGIPFKGVPKRRFRISLTPKTFKEHAHLIREAIKETAADHDM